MMLPSPLRDHHCKQEQREHHRFISSHHFHKQEGDDGGAAIARGHGESCCQWCGRIYRCRGTRAWCCSRSPSLVPRVPDQLLSARRVRPPRAHQGLEPIHQGEGPARRCSGGRHRAEGVQREALGGRQRRESGEHFMEVTKMPILRCRQNGASREIASVRIWLPSPDYF
jgi:hypothetical protein